MVTLNPLVGVNPSVLAQLTTAAAQAPQSTLGQLGLRTLQPSFSLRPSELAFQRHLGGVLSNLNAEARALQGAATALSGSGEAFTSRSATTSNEAVVSANASPGASSGTIQVTVSQLAAAQQNTGTAFTSSALNSFTAGTNRFTLTAGGETRELSVFVGPLDTTRTALTNLATAINAANAGVSAGVEDIAEQGTSRLVLTAGQTGTDATFSLADVSGDIVTATGAGTTSTTAQNAAFTLNDVAGTAQSNTLVQDNGLLELTLTGTSTTPVTVEVGGDPDRVITSTESFVSAVNRFRSFLAGNLSSLTPRLVGELDRELAQARPDLASIGINVNLGSGLASLGREGSVLSINTEALRSAVQTNPEEVQRVLGGLNGLAERVAGVAESVLTSPPASFAAVPTSISPTLTLTQSQNLAQVVTNQLLFSGVFVNRTI